MQGDLPHGLCSDHVINKRLTVASCGHVAAIRAKLDAAHDARVRQRVDQIHLEVAWHLGIKATTMSVICCKKVEREQWCQRRDLQRKPILALDLHVGRYAVRVNVGQGTRSSRGRTHTGWHQRRTIAGLAFLRKRRGKTAFDRTTDRRVPRWWVAIAYFPRKKRKKNNQKRKKSEKKHHHTDQTPRSVNCHHDLLIKKILPCGGAPFA